MVVCVDDAMSDAVVDVVDGIAVVLVGADVVAVVVNGGGVVFVVVCAVIVRGIAIVGVVGLLGGD